MKSYEQRLNYLLSYLETNIMLKLESLLTQGTFIGALLRAGRIFPHSVSRIWHCYNQKIV
jgi:hypothetical protein